MQTKYYLDKVGPAFYVRQISERLGQSLLSALKPYGETPNGYRVLLALTRSSQLTTQELLGETMLIPSTLSRNVEQLKNKGYVKVEKSEEDARAQIVQITDEGREHLENIFSAAASQYQWAIRGISEEEIDNLSKTLLKMLENIKNSPIK